MPESNLPSESTPVRKRGRRSIRTAENALRIADGLARGISFNQVCAAVRVSKAAVADWRAKDPEFEAQIQSAVSAGVERRLKVIEDAAFSGGDQSWRAAAWLLERCQPETFGRQRGEQQHVTVNADKVIVYLPAKGEDSELKQISNSND